MFTVRLAKSQQERQCAYHIRRAVFIAEQNVPEDLERDEYDENGAVHFLGLENGEACAAGRFVLTGDKAKIGRVCVLRARRGKGYGRILMEAIMAHLKGLESVKTIVLNAQKDATIFYENLGFEAQGEEFMEAGIPHTHMELKIERRG